MHKHFSALFFILLAGMLVLTGCSFNTVPTPVAVTVAARPIVLTPVVLIVTSTPRPTLTPSPAPTLAYQPQDYEGGWLMQINYQIYNGAYWSDIRYNAEFNLKVTATGVISGEGTFFPSLQQPPCPAFINGASGLRMKITGTLDALPNGGVVARLQIVPQAPKAVQNFVLACADPDHALGARIALLWPALEATDQLNLTLPFAPATVYSSLRNLTSASGGRLNGTITTEIRLNR